MPAVRDFAVTEITTLSTTASPDMPAHVSGDMLIVFANKDTSTAMTETTGLYTSINSGAISTRAWSGCFYRRATSNSETPPTFTWASETANFVVVSVKNVHATNNPTGYISTDDTTIPYTQDQSISTPSANCLVLHGIGTDAGIGAEPYPGVAQILYAGDAGANGIGVSWAFYPTAVSIGNPTFWGWQAQYTQIHTVIIEDDGNNTEVQGYVDRGTSPCTLVDPYVGATILGWTQQTTVSPLVIGNNFSQVWTYDGTTYVDETTDMASSTAGDVPMSNLINSALYLGSDTTFNKFALYTSVAASGGTVAWEYYNGSTWVTLPMLNANDVLDVTGAHSFQFNIPTDWSTVAVNSVTKYYVRLNTSVARTTGATISQGLRDGAACGYDAITASADVGVNPYHSVSRVTQTSHPFNLVGNERLYSGGIDLSSGYLVGTFMFTSPRDFVDSAFVARLSMVTHVIDTSGNFRSWIIGAKDGATTFSDRRCLFAIQLDETEGSYFASQGSFSAAAVGTIGQFMCSPYGAQSINYSMLMRTNNIVLAGGTSGLPLNFEQIVDAVTKGCSLFPFFYSVGSAVMIWSPVQFGGGDAIHANINLKTFQFPAHYSLSNKILDYHVDANQTGVEFYGKSGDTIKFTNCVFTSDSPYYWRINASASSGATWSFAGTNIAGGTVTLANVMTFSEMGFVGCPVITVSGCTLDNCSITDVPSGNDTLTTNASTNIDNCSINVVGVSSGNRWCSVADPSIFSYCTFTGSASTGHAIRITTPGTYSIYGLVFNSFGSDETNSAAIFNDSGGAVTLTVYGGGSTPTVRNGTGASTTVIAGLVDVTVIVKDISGANIQDARVLVLAAAGGPMPYDATVTITNSGTTATVSHTTHGMATNDKVQIKGASLSANNGVFSITKIDSNSYSYTMGSSPGSNPTGTIKATYAALFGLTDVNGTITTSRVFSSNQPISGRSRKSTTGSLYKTSAIIGTINSATGFSSTVLMISDE